MGQRLLALLLIGAAVVVAAGGGAYLALRDVQPASRPGPVETLSDRQAAEAVPAPQAAVQAAPPDALPGAATTSSRASAGPSPQAGAPRVLGDPARAQRQPRPASRVAGGAAARSSSATAGPAPAPAAPPVAPREEVPTALAVPEPPPGPAIPVAAPEQVPQAPPAPELVDVTVPAEAVIGLQILTTVTSDRAQVEDRVDARVTRDVRADGRVAIPAGSRMEGVVTVAERGGKIKERARVAVRFRTVVLPDGMRVPVQTDTIYREGESPARESTAKIGGAAVGGALLGAILGGGKGAAIGGSIGAAGGTAMVMASDRNTAVLAAGSSVTVRLHAPVTVTVER